MAATWVHVVDVSGDGTGLQFRAESPNAPEPGYGKFIGNIIENFLLSMEAVGASPLDDLCVRYRCLNYDDEAKATKAAESGDFRGAKKK